LTLAEERDQRAWLFAEMEDAAVGAVIRDLGGSFGRGYFGHT